MFSTIYYIHSQSILLKIIFELHLSFYSIMWFLLFVQLFFFWLLLVIIVLIIMEYSSSEIDCYILELLSNRHLDQYCRHNSSSDLRNTTLRFAPADPSLVLHDLVAFAN